MATTSVKEESTVTLSKGDVRNRGDHQENLAGSLSYNRLHVVVSSRFLSITSPAGDYRVPL